MRVGVPGCCWVSYLYTFFRAAATVCQVANPARLAKEGTLRVCWGLTRCGYCGELWNRDRNSYPKISWLVGHALAAATRPPCLCPLPTLVTDPRAVSPATNPVNGVRSR